MGLSVPDVITSKYLLALGAYASGMAHYLISDAFSARERSSMLPTASFVYHESSYARNVAYNATPVAAVAADRTAYTITSHGSLETGPRAMPSTAPRAAVSCSRAFTTAFMLVGASVYANSFSATKPKIWLVAQRKWNGIWIQALISLGRYCVASSNVATMPASQASGAV